MYFVNISDIAEEDILSTVKYISGELKAPKAANDLLDEIERHEEILGKTPHIYPRVPDEYLAGKGLRFVIIKNYLMFFIIEEKELVNVVRFLYGRRDWKNILKNETYEEISRKQRLYNLFDVGLKDIKNDNVLSEEEMDKELDICR